MFKLQTNTLCCDYITAVHFYFSIYNICCIFLQLFPLDDILKHDDNKIMIQDLKDKGDIMDATALATHLIGPDTGLVCPLVPDPTAEHEILRENSNSTTGDMSSQSNLQTIQVNRFFIFHIGNVATRLAWRIWLLHKTSFDQYLAL